MSKRNLYLGILTILALLAIISSAGSWLKIPTVYGAAPEGQAAAEAADGDLVLYYSAKFVCTKALPPGQIWIGAGAPIVEQSTDVLVHNPNNYPVEIWKKANLALVEPEPPDVLDPGVWIPYGMIPAGASFRINCEDIATNLLGGVQFNLGVTYEGFVNIAIGPHPVQDDVFYPQLSVTAEYVRGSEVMKKDVHYQPWWNFWWWDLPWVLGRPYHRLIPVGDTTTHGIMTCEEVLDQTLRGDVADSLMSATEKTDVYNALSNGLLYHPGYDAYGPPSLPFEYALTAIIGKCDEIVTRTEVFWAPGEAEPQPFAPPETALAIDYVLFSTVGPTDDVAPLLTPIGQINPIIAYPWTPGLWNDLPVIFPQNVSIEFGGYFHDWHTQWWQDTVVGANISQFMGSFVPYWCGYGYWWWGYNGTDCIDIGVGEGESLDVEQITPLRMIMPWPPAPPLSE